MKGENPVAGEARMNRAEEREPKSGHERAAGPAHGSDVGNETRADMHGALLGQPSEKNPLHGAVRELHEQHPIEYHDHGPHHGRTDHIRHMPLAGLKPRSE